LAYNLRTVLATAPKLCTLVDIMGPHFCIRRIYERPHRYCLENGKSL